MTKKKLLTAIIAAVVCTAGMLAGCGQTKQEAEPEKIIEMTPTFMYFISNSDADFDATNKMLDELQAEYDGRVQFNIVNIDEDESGLQMLVSEGQTPTLVMTNNSGEAEIKNMCNDKEELKSAIENALK